MRLLAEQGLRWTTDSHPQEFSPGRGTRRSSLSSSHQGCPATAAGVSDPSHGLAHQRPLLSVSHLPSSLAHEAHVCLASS